MLVKLIETSGLQIAMQNAWPKVDIAAVSAGAHATMMYNKVSEYTD